MRKEGILIRGPATPRAGGSTLRSVALALAIVLALMVPTVGATHWTVHEQGIGRGPGDTREDDGAVFRDAASPADGRVNRVVAPGRTPGDGSLFLDAFLGARIGTRDAGFDLFLGHLAGDVLGRPNVLLPAPGGREAFAGHHTSAWYGWWMDGNGDGIIDDVHDAACGTAACPGDEFRWRGIASGNAAGMVTLVTPAAGSGPWSSGPGPGATSDMTDWTSRSNAEQSWRGAFTASGVDAGLLSTVQTFTLAGARADPSSALGYDLEDPDALWDVDRYESLSADAEALWASAMTGGLAPTTRISTESAPRHPDPVWVSPTWAGEALSLP